MTPGMKNALMKSATGGCECGECGQHTGKYRGRYPKVCPNCRSPYKEVYDLENESSILDNINTLINEVDIHALKTRHAEQDNRLQQKQAADRRAKRLRQGVRQRNLDIKQQSQLKTAREKERAQLVANASKIGLQAR